MAISGSDQILNAKEELNKALKSFISNFNNCNTEECVSQLVVEMSVKHSAILNTVNKVIAELHEEKDFFENKDLQQDYVATVENFIPTSLKLIDTINQIASSKGLTKIKVSPKSYTTVQRFINTFAEESSKKNLTKSFNDKGISISGFNQKFNKTMKTKFIKLQLYIGIPLLLLCGAIILFGELLIGKSFNGIQLIFLKGFFSLSISIVAASLIEGNVNVKWTLQTGLAIRAAGWIAVFLLLYFLNPASPGDVH
ncbi:MAG: hypothetical protein K0S33_2722 [Bacteroidetes bacterium]|nr:hypothetical protein [Bacteroidota bacterium]